MKTVIKLGAIAALTFAAAGANATVVKSTYSVDASTMDPGLRISTADVSPNPFSHDLAAGESTSFDLFDIWTEENSLDSSFFHGCGNDCDPKPISVSFGFILPETGVSTVTGETMGRFSGLIFQEGRVSWDGSQSFQYGPNGDGLIEVGLSGTDFNTGLFGIDHGRGDGGTVRATLSLISDASAADVAEPGMLGLFGLALVAMGFAASRRRFANRG